MLYRVHLAMGGIQTHSSGDCMGYCKFNYHAILTKTSPLNNVCVAK
jgi:hypothetical protein